MHDVKFKHVDKMDVNEFEGVGKNGCEGFGVTDVLIACAKCLVG